MGLLGAPMLAEAQAPAGVLQIGIDLDFPSGTRRWSNVPVSSAALGHYEVRIKSYAELPRAFSDRRGGMVSSDFSVTIDDTDQLFMKILGSRERIRDAAARVRILSPNVAAVLYWTGRLYDWSRGSDMSWTLNLRPPDLALKQNFMDITITPSAWPKAADDVRGAIAPVVLGLHDSSGLGTRTGALPTLNVKSDVSPFYRLVSWGRMMSIPHVYEGTAVLPTGNYTIIYPIAAGQRWTVVSFTSNPTGEIRVDGSGVDTVGDGTGTLIDKPTDILKWLAVNRWFQKNTSGLWFADATAPVNATAFDSVKNTPEMLRGANGQPYRSSAYFNAEKTPDDYIREWCLSNRCNLGWTADGKLTAKLISSLASGSYVSSPLFREPHEVDRIEIDYPAQDWIRRILVRYGSQAGGDYIGSEELVDPIIDKESLELLELAAGPGFI